MGRFRTKTPMADYLASHSIEQENGCILWTGATMSKGHGHFTRHYEHKVAHREAYKLAHGEIPDGLIICHRCDTPRCINPEHLFLGTVADNNKDIIALENPNGA